MHLLWKERFTAEGSAFQVAAEIVRLVAMRKGGVAGDSVGANQLAQGLVHRHHSFASRDHDLRSNLVVVALADEIAHGKIGEHDFCGWVATGAIGCGDELLGNDGEQG